MIAVGKHLPRRTILRGAGVAMALPLLDAMISVSPAQARLVSSPVRRLGFVYVPMGCDRSRWTPPGKEQLAELSPILRPLEKVRDAISVLSNMELRNAYPGTHATSNSSFLSAARAKHTESNDYYLSTTVDQIAARQIGQATQLPSLELAMDLMQTVGQCDNGYACVYQNNLSWSSPTTPLPAEAHPRIVFENLFGEGGSADERRRQRQQRASLLDFVQDDLRQLERNLGRDDRTKLDSYLTSIREVERRIQRAESNAAVPVSDGKAQDPERPIGVPASYKEHARLMFDLQLLALHADITRIITFQLARETSWRTYPEVDVSEPHHPLSHHGNDPEKIAKLARINGYHVSLFSEFLEKLRQTPDGNGSLLDHTVYLYGSGMGNPNVHDHQNLPILVAGGAACGFRGGRHIQYAQPTPLANLHLTLLERVGVRLETFADSNGRIDELFEPLNL
jgi:hypothetical protein